MHKTALGSKKLICCGSAALERVRGGFVSSSWKLWRRTVTMAGRCRVIGASGSVGRVTVIAQGETGDSATGNQSQEEWLSVSVDDHVTQYQAAFRGNHRHHSCVLVLPYISRADAGGQLHILLLQCLEVHDEPSFYTAGNKSGIRMQLWVRKSAKSVFVWNPVLDFATFAICYPFSKKPII